MPEIGQTLSHYRIVEKLGTGGMGIVFKAFDSALGRHVALKLLNPTSVAQRERVARFFLEAKAASALNHPNIITIYEIGKSAEDRDFIAMEFVEGWSLRPLAKRPNPLQEVLRVGRQVAEALGVRPRIEFPNSIIVLARPRAASRRSVVLLRL
jgi:serine/threonine protein kinase